VRIETLVRLTLAERRLIVERTTTDTRRAALLAAIEQGVPPAYDVPGNERIMAVVYVRATPAERDLILAQTNPDSRREILLAAIGLKYQDGELVSYDAP
jgi:hypothetical protein